MATPTPAAIQFAQRWWPNYTGGWSTLPLSSQMEALQATGGLPAAPASTLTQVAPPQAMTTTAPAAVTAQPPGAVMSPTELASLRNEILASLRSMTQGAPGSSPLTSSAIEAFKVQTAPVIGNAMTLRGLGHSPAVGQVMGETLAQAMPQLINADLTNRLAATQQMTGIGTRDMDFGLQGSRLAADIANMEGMRELEGFKTAGQLQLGYGDLAARAAQIQQEQQRLALQATQAGGGLQRDITQGVADAIQAERLRLQGLSEGGTFGAFGGAVLPPSVQQSSKTSGSSK